LKQSKCFPLNPTRRCRNSAGPGEVKAVTAKQMISRGASRIIPESANAMSTVLFSVVPTGAGAPTSDSRKTLRVSAKLFITPLQKTKIENPPYSPFLFFFFYAFL
jgi:hypothetical protein